MSIFVNLVAISSLPKIINSFDVPFHVARVVGAWLGWQSGQIIPYVNPVALNGLGLGSNFFYGTWQALILAPIYGLTHSVALTFIIFNLVATFLAGVFMDEFLGQYFKKPATLFASCFYMCSPFMIHNLLVTQDQGAIIGIMLLPIIFNGGYKILNRQAHGKALLALGLAALVSSHILSTFLVIITLIIMVILSWRKLHLAVIGDFIVSGIYSLLLSAFFWVPFLQLKVSNLYNVFAKHIYLMDRTAQFLTHSNSWQPYSFLIKIINILVLVAIILGVVFWRQIKRNSTARQLFLLKQALIITVVFCILSYAPINWQYMPTIFYNMQFLWRFMYIGYFFIAVVLAALINACDFQQRAPKLAYLGLGIILIGLIFGQSWQYGKSVRHAINEEKNISKLANGYKQYNPHNKHDAWYFEYATTGVYQKQSLLTAKQPVIVAQNTAVHDQQANNKTTNKLITASVTASKGSYLVLKKMYYPGYYYVIKKAGKTIKMPVTYNKAGLVMLKLPDNYHGKVVLGYQTPIAYLWLWAVSGTALFALIVSLLRKPKIGEL